MSKRGTSELAIVLVVLLFAVIGTVVVLTRSSETTGMYSVAIEDQPGAIRLPIYNCQRECFGHTEPRRLAQGLAGQALRDCLRDCQETVGVNVVPNYAAYP